MLISRSILVTLSVMVILISSSGVTKAQSRTPSSEEGPCRFGELEAPLPGFEGMDVCEIVDKYTTPDDELGALKAYINVVAAIVTALIVAIGLIMVIVGGYIYMTAGGSADKISQSKTIIGSALLGIVLALTAFLILNTINPQLIGAT